jgi:glycosyltransferase involved in cell wall biosynthesis
MVYPERARVKLMEFVSDFGNGGTERQFMNLGLSLDRSRFDLLFGCLRRWGYHLEEIDKRGIPVFDYGVMTFKNPKALQAQIRLARDVRRCKIQIVHTYNFYANIFAIPPAKIAGARVVASIRDMGVYLSPQRRRLQRYVCSMADRILVNAGAIKDWLVADGCAPQRITIIPNGIDVDRFSKPRASGRLHRELGLPSDAALVGVVGRLTRFKGLETFLEAAAVIAPQHPSARFLIVGDGVGRTQTLDKDAEYRAELERLVARLGLQDRVIFTGFRADVENVFADLSVAVQPSLSEGLSNVLLEAMAAGVPVVATRVGGTSEAIRDGVNGVLVPSADSEALAEAIGSLLAVPPLAARLGNAARRSVTERFSLDQLATNTATFYESLLQS